MSIFLHRSLFISLSVYLSHFPSLSFMLPLYHTNSSGLYAQSFKSFISFCNKQRTLLSNNSIWANEVLLVGTLFTEKSPTISYNL